MSRRVGKGRISYVGALLDDAGMARLATWAATDAGATPLWPGVPNGVEVMARTGPRGRSFILVNWNDTPRTIRLPAPMKDLLAGGTATAVTLNRYDVAVLAR